MSDGFVPNCSIDCFDLSKFESEKESIVLIFVGVLTDA
jgi:hypothetical protein